MSRRDDRISLGDMLSHAREAVELVRGMSREDFAHNRVVQLALTRLVQVIGEAASRVSESTRQRHEAVPWAEIIGMRNRLVHGYDVLDLDVLWETSAQDVPMLIELLDRITSQRDG